eukprot:5003527-Pleurochrysis_carterae.AAC.1
MRACLQVTAGLPGRMVSAYSLSQFQAALDAYATVDAAALRSNLLSFLKQVVPAAEEVRAAGGRGRAHARAAVG